MYPGGFQHGKYTRKILKIWVPSYLRGSYLSPATNLLLRTTPPWVVPAAFTYM